MVSQSHIDDLLAARVAQSDETRVAAVERVHDAGHLTATERLAALLDPGSAVPFGTIAAQSADGAWIAEAGGVDAVGTVEGRTVIASSTDYTDRGGGYGAGRIGRLISVALDHRWPIVFFADGGGSRARHPRVGMGHYETATPVGPITLWDGMGDLSGWVPTVSIVSGPAFAGHASIAGFSDIVISTRGSAIGMGGPPMVEAALGKRLTPNELAGVEMHIETGGIELLVDTEPEAIALAKRYLAFLDDLPGGAPSTAAAAIGALVPDEGPYDVQPVLEALVDDGTLFELRPTFATSVVTALARLGGRTVGIIASQPLVDDGRIDERAATKVGRFVELCDCYEYPIVAVIDTPGTTGPLGRWHTRPLLAHHHRSVPLLSVQLRRGDGLGGAILGGLQNGRNVPTMRLGWPGIELGRPDGYAIVADHQGFDDIVVPAETRDRLVAMLRYLPRAGARDRTVKKHPIDTW